MSLKKLINLPTKVIVEVRQGAIVSIDETAVVEKAIGRKLSWSTVEDSERYSGNQFQGAYWVVLTYCEAKSANKALTEYRKQHDILI